MLRGGILLEDALRVGGEMGGQPEPEPEQADDPLRTLLVEHKLEKYYDALVALGAALPDDLPELEPSDLDQIGMAKLERKRLARCVAGLRGGAMAAAGEAADGQAEDDEEEGAMLVRTTSCAKASQSLKNSKTQTLSRFACTRVAKSESITVSDLATRAFFVEQGLPTDTIDAEIEALRERVAYYEAIAA